MGWFQHHAIVVYSYNRDGSEVAHKKAKELGLRPSPIIDAAVNGGASFYIPPDGSKEGWQESRECDDRREAWKAWAKRDGYGPPYFDWVELRFGGDLDEPALEDWTDKKEEQDAD